jgi:hypothetical protein
VATLAEKLPACRDVATGKQPVGAACVGTMECAAGLVCDRMKCVTPGGEGAECSPVLELTMVAIESTCAAGLHCGARVCQPRVAAGGACSLSSECVGGLRCRGGACVTAGPPAHGGECDEPEDCPPGDFCDLSHRCEKLRADGEPCLLDTQCLNECIPEGDSVSGRCGPCAP